MIELELLSLMIINTKTTKDLKEEERVDAFFMNNPTPAVRDLMKDAILTFISGLDLQGKKLADIKLRKTYPGKIACLLRDMKVDGWVDFDICHTNTYVYKMYKALTDMFYQQLKTALLNKKTVKSEEMIIDLDPVDDHRDVKLDDHSCGISKTDAMIIDPKEETKSETDLRNEIASVEK